MPSPCYATASDHYRFLPNGWSQNKGSLKDSNVKWSRFSWKTFINQRGAQGCQGSSADAVQNLRSDENVLKVRQWRMIVNPRIIAVFGLITFGVDYGWWVSLTKHCWWCIDRTRFGNNVKTWIMDYIGVPEVKTIFYKWRMDKIEFLVILNMVKFISANNGQNCLQKFTGHNEKHILNYPFIFWHID